MAKTGSDLLFVVRFDLEFAALSPEAFVRQYLIEGLQILQLPSLDFQLGAVAAKALRQQAR
jgi:FAD synthase